MIDGSNNDNANKLNYFTQSWLTYYEKGKDTNVFLNSVVDSKTKDDEVYYVFSDDVTITYRYRRVIKFYKMNIKEKYASLISIFNINI